MITERDSHFRAGGHAYAAHRPTYPARLATILAARSPRQACAVDVGCGTGQLTCLLAEVFDHVIASDISADQIAHTTPHDRITYHVAPAQEIAAANGTVDLVTVGQAAHWLDLDPFYAEVRRVAAPSAVIALISYGVMEVDGPVAERFEQFYWKEMEPYWPPERRHVETGYADLPFPFDPLPCPRLIIERQWALAPFLGYIRTWSAVKTADDLGHSERIEAFEAELKNLWGDPARTFGISWPLSLRLGRINSAH